MRMATTYKRLTKRTPAVSGVRKATNYKLDPESRRMAKELALFYGYGSESRLVDRLILQAHRKLGKVATL